MSPPSSQETPPESQALDEAMIDPRLACCFCGLRTKLPRNPELGGLFFVRVVMALVVVDASIAYGPALLHVVKQTAGCDTERDACSSKTCNNKIWGLMSPASYLSVALTIASLTMAFCSPLLGAWCDFTPHRKGVLVFSIAAAGALAFCGTIIDYNSTILFVLFVAITLFHMMYTLMSLTSLSYLTELTPHPKHNSATVSMGYIWMFSTEIIAALTLIAINFIFGLTTTAYARVTSIIVGSTCLIALFPISKLLLPREAARQRPGGISIPRYAFSRLRQLQKDTRRKFPDLSKLLFGVMIYDPASNALVVLAATYLVDELCLAASKVSIVLAVALAASIPGVRFSGHFFHNPQRARFALMGSLVGAGLVTLAAPFVLEASATLGVASLFGFVWGFLLAIEWTTTVQLITQLTPGGQEAEIAGLAQFAYKALQWLPPLVFTVFNEAASIKFALLSLPIFFFVGAFVVFFVDVNRASEIVEQTLAKRRSFWTQKANASEPNLELNNVKYTKATLRGESTITRVTDLD